MEWVDVGAEESIQKKPLKIDGTNIMRPDLSLAWFTLDPRDPTDALLDPDNDGDWDCSELFANIMSIQFPRILCNY